MSDLAQANRILDRTCKRAGVDPVELRLAMIQTLQANLANGKGFSRLPPTKVVTPPGATPEQQQAMVDMAKGQA